MIDTKKAVFLDRDGTINREIGHLYSSSELEFIPGVIDAIKEIRNQGYLVVVITNQAGVARGLYREEDVVLLHKVMNQRLMKEGAFIDAFYYCPHHPEAVVEKYRLQCNCRKPKPGMILKAFEDLGVNPEESILIGDKESDILAGENAGITHNFIVRSGYRIDEKNTKAEEIFDDLKDFIIKGGLARVKLC